MIKILENKLGSQTAIYNFTCEKFGSLFLLTLYAYDCCFVCSKKKDCIVDEFIKKLGDKNLVTNCNRCGNVLDPGYIMILYALKSKGFLPDNHPLLCCNCYHRMKRDLDANNRNI